MSTPPLPFDKSTLPDGWFSDKQIRRLYQLACETPGPILEVGSWIGRSTSVIAYALQGRADRVEFHTVDYGISSEEEWTRLLGGNVRDKPKPERYLMHINQPGGTLTSLRRNLDARGLLDLVQIHRGDFHSVAPVGPYGLVFCDATHNRREVDANVPTLLKRLKPNGVLACDDISDELFQYMTERFAFKWTRRDELLFSAEPS